MVYSAEILEEGIPAIENLATFLRKYSFYKCFTSEILRCVQTSQVVEKITGFKFEKYSRLNEFVDETFDEFKERISNAIERFESVNGKTYLICTHGAVISALKHLLVTGKYEEKDFMDFPSPGNLIIVDQTGFRIKNFNKL